MKNKTNKWSMRNIAVGALILIAVSLLTIIGESRNTPITSDQAKGLLQAEAEAQQLPGVVTNLLLDDPKCQWEGYGHCTVHVEFDINGLDYAGRCTYGPFEDEVCTITGEQTE